MNEKEILKRVEETGGFLNPQDEKMFKCLTLTEEEYDFLIKEKKDVYSFLKKFAKKNKIDFICVQYNKEISFIHTSSVENKESIEKDGLLDLTYDFIMDLGQGIYVVEEYDREGMENLDKYLENEYDILYVCGTYNGPFKKCIYGVDHEGYVVLEKDVPKENISVEITTVDQMFSYYE